MQKKISIIFLFFLLQNVLAQPSDKVLFHSIFFNWTYDFNHKHLKPTCELFSKNIKANYQDVPQRTYQTICAGFKKIFALSNEHFSYKFKIHRIVRCNDFAAVRITWFLQHTKNKKTEITQDEGIDIFKRNPAGKWQIIDYLAYPVLRKS